MQKYLWRRLLLTLPVVFGVVSLTFFLIHLVPGDPVEIMLGDAAQAADKLRLRHELGLDQPLGQQYLSYLSRVIHGDLGHSLRNGSPVQGLIWERLPATAELALGAIIIALCIALPLGILSALYPSSWIDRLSMFLAMLGVSLPNFWLGPLLILFFALKLGWLPIGGREGWEHLILPASTLGLALSAILTRMTRGSLLEVIHEDYMRTARAKGLSRIQALVRHALRNALIPVLTVLGLQLGGLLSGSLIIETIFAWPGLGRLTIQAINTRDYALVQGCVLVMALSYVCINLFTDIAYAWINPRLRVRPNA